MDLFTHAAARRNPPEPENGVLTVTALTRRVRDLLEDGIGSVRVEGEVSNFRRQASGHCYFTLKDAGAQLACVLFRSSARDLRVPLQDGALVRVSGSITVYEARGQYQMIVRSVQAAGAGALQAQFEALKRRLQAEGLFDPAHRKPVPAMPRTVLLITSPDGAALRDMLQILGRRAPWVRVLVHPVRVQGAGSAEEIAAALAFWSAPHENLPQVDTIVVTRGGGSLEDLWAFNEEIVARAIFACPIPVISAVGHEIDFTIADFVADLRAPTPSAAAELLAPDAGQLLAGLRQSALRLNRCIRQVIEHHQRVLHLMAGGILQRDSARLLLRWTQPLDEFAGRLTDGLRSTIDRRAVRLQELHHRLERHSPDRLLSVRSATVAVLAERLSHAAASAVERRNAVVSRQAAVLHSLGPQSVLARGFSYTLGPDGSPVTDPATLKPGDEITTRLAAGSVRSTVRATEP